MAKILIVDDDPDIAKLYSMRLVQEGFSVVSAADAYQGVKYARTEKPDLVLLDLMLPAGGGLSVLTNIRNLPDTKKTPVIVLTGSKDPSVRQKVTALGVSAFFEKSTGWSAICAAIRSVLSKSE